VEPNSKNGPNHLFLCQYTCFKEWGRWFSDIETRLMNYRLWPLYRCSTARKMLWTFCNLAFWFLVDSGSLGTADVCIRTVPPVLSPNFLSVKLTTCSVFREIERYVRVQFQKLSTLTPANLDSGQSCSFRRLKIFVVNKTGFEWFRFFLVQFFSSCAIVST